MNYVYSLNETDFSDADGVAIPEKMLISKVGQSLLFR